MVSVGIEPGMTVLDLCCGDGYFTIPLAKLADKVYGLELDSELLKLANQSAVENGVTNCCWILGDALNVADHVVEKLDLVLIANTFHGIPDKMKMAQVIHELLKSKGKFVVINWYNRPREETVVLGLPRGPKTEMRMSPEHLSCLLVSAGFIFEKTVDVSAYHYASVFTKPSE